MKLIRRLGIAVGALVLVGSLCIAAAPYAYYHYGLSLTAFDPVPPSPTISAETRDTIWIEFKGIGKPRLRQIGPWGYVLFLSCNSDLDFSERKSCHEKFPGVLHAAMAVRPQVSSALDDKRALKWKAAWIAHTVKATQTWALDEILVALENEYGT